MNKVKLSVFRNDQLVDSYEFDAIEGVEQEVIIGRASDSHISLADHQVSRHHISLTYSSGILSLKNISQYQNVYVNGKNVNNALVSDTDSIQFYDYTLTIKGATGIHSLIPDNIESLLNETEKITNTFSVKSSRDSEKTVLMEIPQVEKDSIEQELSLTDKDEVSSFETTELEMESTGPIIKNNNDIKTITQRIQNILSKNEEENNAFGIDETEFEDEIGKESEVLEFTEELNYSSSGGKDLSLFDEDTGVIENFAQIYLSISGENVPYHKYILDKKETLIGSSKKSCDIILEDSGASEVHARIIYDKKRVWVEDLDSQNGTYVNGEKVNKAEINQGDEVLIGSISFVLKVGSEVLSEEAKRLMPVSSEQEVIEHQMVSSADEAEGFSIPNVETVTSSGLKSKFQAMMANPQQKRMFYYVLIIIAVLVLIDDSEDTSKKITKKTQSGQSTTVNETQKEIPLEKAVERSDEELEYLESHYLLAKAKIEEGNYDGALFDAELVKTIDPNYKNIESIASLAKQGLVALDEAEKRKKEEQERLETEKQIKELLAKAGEAMNDNKLILAETYLNKIAEFDPENSNLYSLKLEIDAARKEQERLRKENEEKVRIRDEFLEALAPAKVFVAQNEWFKAIKTVEKVLKINGLEPDLLKEASDILKESQAKLKEETEALLTEARTFKQGEDLKNAYEVFLKLLKKNPISGEALTELGEIEASLDGRAKLVYREALVSESISLFSDAKEKYLEVLQIAPAESDYYKKAKAKLDEFYVE